MPRQKHQSSEEMMAMLSTIDIRSDVAVYVQIENHVQFAISAGRLNSGDQLPSVRELSERLDVNPNTVAKAYRDLEVMGLLYTRRGMGVFVNEGIEEKCQDDCRLRVVKRIHEVVAEASACGMAPKEVSTIVDKCLKIGGTPYGQMPAGVLALAKPKRRR